MVSFVLGHIGHILVDWYDLEKCVCVYMFENDLSDDQFIKGKSPT